MTLTCARRLLSVLLLLLVVFGSDALTASADAAGFHLERGSRGAAVRTLEVRLVKVAALPRAAVDRRYRAATVRAVKRFQRARRLRVTGTVNRHTWGLVAAAYRRASRPRPRPAPPAPPAWRPPTWAPPSVTAHRGGALEAPENTLAAIRSSVQRGADIVEFDVRSTSDHQLVLLHDRTLDRTTDCTGEVFTKTLAEVRACRTEGSGQPVPTFEEVATYLATVDVRLSPEIEQYGTDVDRAELADFVEILRARGLMGRALVQSFRPEVFPDLRALQRADDPEMTLAYVARTALPAETVKGAGAQVASVNLAALGRAHVDAYHRLGLEVHTWTATTRPQLQAAWSLHVDSVITDIPSVAKQLYE